MGHRINQILYKLEAVVLLIAQPISIIMRGYDRRHQYYLYKFPSDKIAQAIYVLVERIPPGCIPMFRF